MVPPRVQIPLYSDRIIWLLVNKGFLKFEMLHETLGEPHFFFLLYLAASPASFSVSAMDPTRYEPIKTKDYLSLVKNFPPNVPVTLIHMLRFHDIAIYPPSSPHASLESMTGRDAFYKRYVAAGNAAAQQVGITPAETKFCSASVTSLLLGLNDVPWDVVTARKFASFEEYARYQMSRSYQENAVPHRDAALKDWSLVALVEEEPPKI